MRPSLLTRLRRGPLAGDARDGLVMTAATTVAGGFDYLVLVVAGLLLHPAAAITFLAVMNLLKIAEQITWVIRNLVAYYVATFALGEDAPARIGTFLRRRWRWAWRWGGAAALATALLAVPLDRLLEIGSPAALLAAAAALLLFFLRPVTDGALQGLQRFAGLGVVVIAQALARFGLTILLIQLGFRVAGAVLALPLAAAIGLALALWLLRAQFRAPAGEIPRLGLAYSTLTLVGLWAFALLVYGDAVLINRLFVAEVAEAWTPAAILARLNLFVPLALGMVFFPKATQRHALGQDARPLLLLTLMVTLLPGALLAGLFFLAPGPVVALVFRGQYGDPGALLGWVALATTLFAGANIWLNYALALQRRAFVAVLAVLAALQVAAILFWAGSLLDVATVMVGAGVLANLAGAGLFFGRARHALPLQT